MGPQDRDRVIIRLEPRHCGGPRWRRALWRWLEMHGIESVRAWFVLARNPVVSYLVTFRPGITHSEIAPGEAVVPSQDVRSLLAAAEEFARRLPSGTPVIIGESMADMDRVPHALLDRWMHGEDAEAVLAALEAECGE